MLVMGAQDAVNLLRFFDDLPDPRSNVNRLHRLGDVIVMTAPSYLHGRSEWKGLKTMGAAVRVYEENGIEKRDVRYYISSLRRNGQQFANAVRRHWGIENSLHWSLDMTYREDESRVRNRTFAENLSWLRRLTLSLIKHHPGKQSNIMKRRMAGWSPDFLMQVLTGKGT